MRRILYTVYYILSCFNDDLVRKKMLLFCQHKKWKLWEKITYEGHWKKSKKAFLCSFYFWRFFFKKIKKKQEGCMVYALYLINVLELTKTFHNLPLPFKPMIYIILHPFHAVFDHFTMARINFSVCVVFHNYIFHSLKWLHIRKIII